MKVSVIVVGKPGARVADAIAEYEKRAARYWNLDVVEVKEERGRKGSEEQVRAAESERLLQRVPAAADVCALSRDGKSWSSDEFARYLDDLAVHSKPGVAFLIGGALGISDDALRRADRKLSLSSMTLTHEMARLVLAEQLYRAGTILRGEPYHKARR